MSQHGRPIGCGDPGQVGVGTEAKLRGLAAGIIRIAIKDQERLWLLDDRPDSPSSFWLELAGLDPVKIRAEIRRNWPTIYYRAIKLMKEHVKHDARTRRHPAA